jgi:hypothetical protein
MEHQITSQSELSDEDVGHTHLGLELEFFHVQMGGKIKEGNQSAVCKHHIGSALYTAGRREHTTSENQSLSSVAKYPAPLKVCLCFETHEQAGYHSGKEPLQSETNLLHI